MTDVDPNAQLWDLLRGALAPKALGISADSGVADALASGLLRAAEIADENGADPDALHRILRALASDGVFAEDEPGVFRNTPASELLRDGQSNSWPEFAHLLRGIVFDLPEPVRDDSSFGDRMEFVAGNFLEQVPRGDFKDGLIQARCR